MKTETILMDPRGNDAVFLLLRRKNVLAALKFQIKTYRSIWVVANSQELLENATRMKNEPKTVWKESENVFNNVWNSFLWFKRISKKHSNCIYPNSSWFSRVLFSIFWIFLDILTYISDINAFWGISNRHFITPRK